MRDASRVARSCGQAILAALVVATAAYARQAPVRQNPIGGRWTEVTA